MRANCTGTVSVQLHSLYTFISLAAPSLKQLQQRAGARLQHVAMRCSGRARVRAAVAGSHGAHAVPALPRFGQQHVIAVRNLVASAGNGTPEVLVAAGSLRDAADGLAAPAGPRPVALTELAEACCGAQAAVGPASASTAPGLAAAAPWALAAAGVAAGALALKRLYDTPSRAYDGNVGDEYDAWTEEGILEHYWGEHIHLGYYTDAERAAGWWKADFKANKLRFTQEMFAFSRSKSPRRILDVGCGFGGSSRWLAAQFPDAEVVGITLSHRQVQRGTELAQERGLNNVTFKVMDALNMSFEDGSFDLVWACESGEHMPDKAAYVSEMARVLAPGGNMVIACWCQREAGINGAPPLSEEETSQLDFLYKEWAHPFFISIQEFCRLMQGTGMLEAVDAEDWTPQTLPSWRHSNLVGVLDPWFVVGKWNPALWYKVTREIVTLERMHRAFDRGLMQYGLMRAAKPATLAPAAVAETAEAAPAVVP